MDLLPTILSALHSSLYLLMALLFVSAVLLLIYLTGIHLATPLCNKILHYLDPDMSNPKESEKSPAERKRLETQRRTTMGRALGVTVAGFTFFVVWIWEQTMLDLYPDRKVQGETLWEMFVTVMVKVIVEGSVVMGFLRGVAAVMP